MRPHLISSAKRQCPADGRCFALSLTAGAPPQLRAPSRYFTLDFSLRNWAASWLRTDLGPSPTRSAWRFHVPRIWIRSINGRIFSVKRKTQNVVDILVLRLFVVVLFPLNRFCFNTFASLPLTLHSLHPIPYETLSRRACFPFCSFFSPFRANTYATLCFNLRSRLLAACSRRKTSHRRNSQRRKNHGYLVPRRPTQGSGSV